MSSIDVSCPLCGATYHSDHIHVGKRIRCSRCGSVVPILDVVTSVMHRPGDVVVGPDASAVQRKPNGRPSHTPAWAIGAVSIVLIIGLCLTWPYFANDHTADKTVNEPLTNATPQSEGVVVTPATGHALDQSSVLRPAFYHSLPSGSRLCRGKRTSGKGVLRVENGTTEDAALRLYDISTEVIVRCIFVKAGDSFKLTGIPEGTYGLKYATGLDWLEGSRTFRWMPFYSRFEKAFQYSETRNGDVISFDEIRVTLQPVIAGNVRTTSISSDEYLKGDQDETEQLNR